MGWLRHPLSLLVCLSLLEGLVHAEDREAAGGTDIAYDHKGQFGVHAQFGTGYRVIFPYEETPRVYCGQLDDDGMPKEVCTGRSPFFVETGISYAFTSAVSALLDARFGIESDFKPPGSGGSTPRALVLAPGVKVFIDDEGSTKFFSTLQAALDLTDFEASGADTGTDIAIRNVNGVQIDFHPSFGVYVHFGETIGFTRWLRFELDAGVGLQGRYP
jgi:hypothetical protein